MDTRHTRKIELFANDLVDLLIVHVNNCFKSIEDRLDNIVHMVTACIIRVRALKGESGETIDPIREAGHIVKLAASALEGGVHSRGEPWKSDERLRHAHRLRLSSRHPESGGGGWLWAQSRRRELHPLAGHGHASIHHRLAVRLRVYQSSFLARSISSSMIKATWVLASAGEIPAIELRASNSVTVYPSATSPMTTVISFLKLRYSC